MRSIVKLLGVALIALLGFMLLGYWAGSSANRPVSPSVGTSGSIDASAARERAAQVGEKAAQVGEKAAIAAEAVRDTVSEAGLTGKIKAKMALDDTVKALNIDVTTVGSTVTLSGRVSSMAERDRAVALAKETDDVTRVVDNLQIGR
jgi:osmotically-inducible protein OsmY